MLQQLLHKPVPQPNNRGRVVRFGQEELDIKLATGSMPDRIQMYLQCNQCPATAKEISTGIASHNGRVARVLQQLLKDQKIRCIQIDGCVTEYEIV